MAQAVDFFPSNSSIHLIGSDMPVKLRDGEQTHLIYISPYLSTYKSASPCQNRGAPDTEVTFLLGCICYLLLLDAQGLCEVLVSEADL